MCHSRPSPSHYHIEMNLTAEDGKLSSLPDWASDPTVVEDGVHGVMEERGNDTLP